MAILAAKNLNDSGAIPTLDALVDVSNTAPVGSGRDTFLVLRNSNAATRTVDIVVAGNTDYGVALPDKQWTLAATTGEVWIPLRRAYVDPNVPGRCTFTVSATAGVTGAVVQVG